MGVCHSHNALCHYMFAGNVVDGVKDVFVHETSKDAVEKEKSSPLVEMIQQLVKLILKEDNEMVNVLWVTEKEEILKSGVDLEHCLVIMLKKKLWIFVAKMGRGGCTIYTCFSSPFSAMMLNFNLGCLMQMHPCVESYHGQFVSL